MAYSANEHRLKSILRRSLPRLEGCPWSCQIAPTGGAVRALDDSQSNKTRPGTKWEEHSLSIARLSPIPLTIASLSNRIVEIVVDRINVIRTEFRQSSGLNPRSVHY